MQTAYTSSKKKSSLLMQVTCNRWQTHLQTYSNNLTQVSIPAKDGSQQSSTFTQVHQRPVSKYPTHAYTKHKQGNKT
jgi:hypothetical protein